MLVINRFRVQIGRRKTGQATNIRMKFGNEIGNILFWRSFAVGLGQFFMQRLGHDFRKRTMRPFGEMLRLGKQFVVQFDSCFHAKKNS